MLIRRDVIRGDRDQNVVKWALIAAVFALSMGCVAEVTLVRVDDDSAAAVASQTETATPKKVTVRN
jgi:hypothetical protein